MSPEELALVRLDNALRLFDEFVQATVRSPDAGNLRGLERMFAVRLGIQASYWSQIKARKRHIGERLARQFEQQCLKPWGWLDQPHLVARPDSHAMPATAVAPGHAPLSNMATPPEPSPFSEHIAAERPQPTFRGPEDWQPVNAEERFITSLVLAHFRRYPDRTRARLSQLLNESLSSSSADAWPLSSAARPAGSVDPLLSPIPTSLSAPHSSTGGPVKSPAFAARPPAASDDSLWRQAVAPVAPLRPKQSKR